MAWAFDDEDPAVWIEGQPLPARVREHVEAGGKVFGHNVGFEWAVWNEIMAKRHGWPALSIEQCDCTMIMSYAMGLPGALESAAMALGLATRKDAEGRALMLRMARPRSKAGVTPIVWWNEPEKLSRLYLYCMQDVRVEREIHKRVLPLSPRERQVWLLDHKINQRGVAVDLVTARAATDMAEQLKVVYGDRLSELTNKRVASVNAVIPMKELLTELGVRDAEDGLNKQDVIDLIDALKDSVNPHAVLATKILTIRQEAGKASNAKFDKMIELAGDDGRLHNMYQYHAAGTGRWGGRGVQTHNLVRNMPKPSQVASILEHVRRGDYASIDMIYGPPLSVLSSCLRSFFMAPEGMTLLNGDFANIESRGQAWFAGEQWKLEAFVAADEGRGPGIYELAYARSFGVPVESVLNPSEERQVGKVQELSFAFQGGIGAGRTMCKTYNVKATDEQIQDWKFRWRDAHPAITAVWPAIEEAAIAAVQNPGTPFTCGVQGRHATFKTAGSFLWCRLPSGRVICYPYPKILEGMYGPQLTYMTVPNPDDAKKHKIIDDPMNSHSWVRLGAYGGSLFNNIVQGFSRDLLADVLLALDAAGAQIVLHTHDDVVAQVALEKAERARAAMENMMRTPGAWAAGLPLYAKVAIMERYGK